MGRKAKVLLAALISAPLAAQTYDPTLIPPQIIGSPQGMNPLNLGDDNTRAVNLGFTFDYYGTSYTSAWVSSNGFVSFNGPDDLCCNGYPMNQSPRNTIYGYWTDLISGGNPYYKSIDNGILFGWYGTKEYGTNNSETFEIALYANGNIQINYGNVANTYHYVAAGLTGPTTSDNLQLFYGTNVQNLSNQSGLFTLLKPVEEQPPVAIAPTPTPTAAPTPVQITPVQSAAIQAAPTETQEVAVQTTATITPQSTPEPVQTTQVAATDTVVATPTEAAPVEQTTTTAEQTTQQAETQQTVQVATVQVQQETKEEQKEAPLPPGGIPGVPVLFAANSSQPAKTATSETVQQVEIKKDRPRYAASIELATLTDLSKDAVMVVGSQDIEALAKLDDQYTQKYGDQKTSDTVDVTYSLDPKNGSAFGQIMSGNGEDDPAPVSSFSSASDGISTNQVATVSQASRQDAPVVALTTTTDNFSVSGQSQQFLLLNMQTEMSSGTPRDIGDVSKDEAQAMAQLAVTPVGYSAYTQARIPDMPFYRPKDIYLNKRIPDANMALYRMMRGQDRLWDKMTEEQYGR